jgi:hypothetical protein
MPDAMRTPRPTIDAFLLKIIIEERFGSVVRPNFPDLPDPRAHKRGLTRRICAGTRLFPRRDFAGRSAPAPTPSVFTSAPGLQISRSVGGGLGCFTGQFSFCHRRARRRRRYLRLLSGGATSAPDWAHPSHICSAGLGSPLPEVGAAAGALAGSAGSTVVLEYPLGCAPAVPLNPMQSPQVWKSTESVGWEKMVVPGKVVPFS